MQGLGVSRRTLFEQVDRSALRPLPRTRYELATWQPCRVNIDHHVQVDHNFYSVPYQLVPARVEARVPQLPVEVVLSGQRVAVHPRLVGRGRFSTQVAHMPHAHRAHAEWTPSRLIAWAEQTGPATGRLAAGILERRPHPEQGYRACLGLMRLGRLHGADRLEAACDRAERLRSYRLRTVEHILTHQQDRLPLEEPTPARRRSRTRMCAAPPTTRRLMLTNPTIEKLQALRLTAMAEAFDQQRSSSQYAVVGTPCQCRIAPV
jgi:transposase